MNTLVSIVVAVYNAEGCLARCLDSLLTQSYKNIEIVCVNDASTDNSQAIIDEYVKRDNRVRSIIHRINMNAGGAMNDGIKSAKGEYVCIVDNDDWLDEKSIEELLKVSDGGKIDIISCDWYRYYCKEKKIEMKNLSDSDGTYENVDYSLKNGWRILGSLIRRTLFVKNNLFFPENVFFEDNAIETCILCYAESIRPLHKALYYYFETPGSVTRTISKQKVLDRMKTTQLFYYNMESRGFVNTYSIDVINYRYLLFSYNTLMMLAESEGRWSRRVVNDLSKEIQKRMPNETLVLLKPRLVPILSAPKKYYQRLRLIHIFKSFIPDNLRSWGRNLLHKSS